MKLRKKSEAEPSQSQAIEPFVNGSNFAGDFTYYIGPESMHTGIGMNIEDSKKYAEATRQAIRHLYPKLDPSSDLLDQKSNS